MFQLSVMKQADLPIISSTVLEGGGGGGGGNIETTS